MKSYHQSNGKALNGKEDVYKRQVMAYDIGPRIGIKGEKEFNNQIQNINQNLKVLGSELKATTSKFEENANSQEALVAKNKILNQQLDAQKQKFSIIEAQIDKENSKLNDLANALKKATNEFGENSVEVQKAQNAYNKQAANAVSYTHLDVL